MTQRPQAVCRASDPICPGCGNFLRMRMKGFRGGGIVGTCMNRQRGADGKNCDQPAVLIPGDGELVTVIAISKQERDALLGSEGRPLLEVLEELGILTTRAW